MHDPWSVTHACVREHFSLYPSIALTQSLRLYGGAGAALVVQRALGPNRERLPNTPSSLYPLVVFFLIPPTSLFCCDDYVLIVHVAAFEHIPLTYPLLLTVLCLRKA